MEFIKKNYEKVLLAVVLAGLTIGVCLLPFYLSHKREDLAGKRTQATALKVKELPPADLEAFEAAAQRAQTPVAWQYTRDHNLVNPILWQKGPAPENLLYKGEIKKQGPDTLEVTDIRPLYLRLGYNGTVGTSYQIGFTNDLVTKAIPQHTGEHLAKKDEKQGFFILRDVKGPPDKPTELVLEMTDNNEKVSLFPGKGYERVEGYEADLKYPPEQNKLFKKQHRDSVLILAGEKYNLVAITASNVVVSAAENKKKTTINYKP